MNCRQGYGIGKMLGAIPATIIRILKRPSCAISGLEAAAARNVHQSKASVERKAPGAAG
jgi:hypothetical protein